MELSWQVARGLEKTLRTSPSLLARMNLFN